jgi:hypothetical protein
VRCSFGYHPPSCTAAQAAKSACYDVGRVFGKRPLGLLYSVCLRALLAFS